MEMGSCFLVVRLVGTTEQIEIAIYKIAIEDCECLCKVSSTSFEVRIVDIT